VLCFLHLEMCDKKLEQFHRTLPQVNLLAFTKKAVNKKFIPVYRTQQQRYLNFASVEELLIFAIQRE